MSSRALKLALIVILALPLVNCAHKPSQAEMSALPPPADGSGTFSGEDEGPGSQTDLRRTAGSDRVFFALDSNVLDARAQDTLRRQAGWLASYPAKSISIEGHCDERGTREYNLALGERRANAAKNYLATLGVDPARMSIVSYGKERPDATGSDEQSYALNRRAVTVVAR